LRSERGSTRIRSSNNSPKPTERKYPDPLVPERPSLPPDPALWSIANYLCPGKAAEAKGFFRKLKASKAGRSAAWAERVLRGEVELCILAAQYDGGIGLFDRVFVALLDSAGIRHGPHDDKQLDFYGLREQLWNANSRHNAALGGE